MTYYGAKDIARSFATVRNNTIQIAEEIPELQYDFQASPDSRSIRRQLIHMVNAPSFQYHLHAEAKLSNVEGFDFMGFMGPIQAEETKPYTKAEIIGQLKAGGQKLEQWMAGLDEAFLAETVSFPPPLTPSSKSRFEMIISIKEHEMHHRAQLMAWLRMIGITPHMTRAREENMRRMQAESAKDA